MTSKQFISEFHREESGDDLLEYALVVAVVLATVMTGSTRLATTVHKELAEIIRDIRKLVHKAF
jgi:Flp pilus assembly pilin Flp